MYNLKFLLIALPALLNSMDRFKFDVFAAKSAAISSSVVAILSFSANLQIITAGSKAIAGTERDLGD